MLAKLGQKMTLPMVKPTFDENWVDLSNDLVNVLRGDKEKQNQTRELSDFQSQLDLETRNKQDAEKNFKTLEMQV